MRVECAPNFIGGATSPCAPIDTGLGKEDADLTLLSNCLLPPSGSSSLVPTLLANLDPDIAYVAARYALSAKKMHAEVIPEI